MCSEAWRRRHKNGLKGSLRNHAPAQATADIISETEMRHVPKTELQDETSNKEICCSD